MTDVNETMPDYDDNLLLGYVEDELSDADRAEVEKWIADDLRLASLLRGLIADRQALRDLPQPDAPAWVLDDVDQGLERSMLLHDKAVDHEQVIVHQRHVARRVLTGLAMAAMVLLAASAVIWSIMMTNNEPVHYQAAGETDSGSAEVAQSPASTGPTEVAMDQPRNEKREDRASAPVAMKGGPTVERSTDHTMALKPGAPAALREPAPVAAPVMTKAGPAPIQQVTLSTPAESFQVLVQTDDMTRTVAQLNDVARNIPNARLIAEAPDIQLASATSAVGTNTTMDRFRSQADEDASQAIAQAPLNQARSTTAAAPTQPVTASAPSADSSPTATRVSKAGPRPMKDAAPAADTVAAKSAPAKAADTAPEVAANAEPQTPPAEQQDSIAKQAAPTAPDTPAAPAAATLATQQQRTVTAADTAVSVKLNYHLVVPADQLQKALVMLQAPSFNNVAQNVALQGQPRVAQTVQLTRRNTSYWPNRSPDYAAVLREQLPAVPAPALTPAPGSGSAAATDANASQSQAATAGQAQPPVQQAYTDLSVQQQAAPAAPAAEQQAEQPQQPAASAAPVEQAKQQAADTVVVPIVIEMQALPPITPNLPAELQSQPAPAETQPAPNAVPSPPPPPTAPQHAD